MTVEPITMTSMFVPSTEPMPEPPSAAPGSAAPPRSVAPAAANPPQSTMPAPAARLQGVYLHRTDDMVHGWL